MTLNRIVRESMENGVQLLVNKTYCPYCGEPIELVIDSSVSDQHYIEDCFVCCRPISVSVSVNDYSGEVEVVVASEDDVTDY